MLIFQGVCLDNVQIPIYQQSDTIDLHKYKKLDIYFCSTIYTHVHHLETLISVGKLLIHGLGSIDTSGTWYDQRQRRLVGRCVSEQALGTYNLRLSPCPGFQSPPRIVIFDRQSQPKPLPRLHPGGDNPNMKLKTLVQKPGGHLRLATDIYSRSSIYNINVCPLFQLDAVWPTQMQHKTKRKTAKPPTKVSYLIPKNPWQPQKHIKNMHPRVTCKGKKKHLLHPGRLVNPSDVEGGDAQICARWIRGRRQRKLVVHRPDGAQDPRCVTIQICVSSDGYDGYDGL